MGVHQRESRNGRIIRRPWKNKRGGGISVLDYNDVLRTGLKWGLFHGRIVGFEKELKRTATY